jgi:hypothetical protein
MIIREMAKVTNHIFIERHHFCSGELSEDVVVTYGRRLSLL